MAVLNRQRLASGELPDSFPDFYAREWRDVVGLGYVLTGDLGVAEDLAQDAFLAASRCWDRVGVMDKPGAWVRRAVSNRSVSWFRRRQAEKRALSQMGNQRAPKDLHVTVEVQEVWAALRKLPKRQAQTLALTQFEGMTLREAADVLGCSYETARTHSKRGRSRLARELGVEEERHA